METAGWRPVIQHFWGANQRIQQGFSFPAEMTWVAGLMVGPKLDLDNSTHFLHGHHHLNDVGRFCWPLLYPSAFRSEEIEMNALIGKGKFIIYNLWRTCLADSMIVWAKCRCRCLWPYHASPWTSDRHLDENSTGHVSWRFVYVFWGLGMVNEWVKAFLLH